MRRGIFLYLCFIRDRLSLDPFSAFFLLSFFHHRSIPSSYTVVYVIHFHFLKTFLNDFFRIVFVLLAKFLLGMLGIFTGK